MLADIQAPAFRAAELVAEGQRVSEEVVGSHLINAQPACEEKLQGAWGYTGGGRAVSVSGLSSTLIAMEQRVEKTMREFRAHRATHVQEKEAVEAHAKQVASQAISAGVEFR